MNTEFIDDFFSHESMKIKTKFILITHNSDYLLTNEKHLGYLNDNNNLLAWFGHNPRFEHSKFIPIPIGIENTRRNLQVSVFEIFLLEEDPFKF